MEKNDLKLREKIYKELKVSFLGIEQQIKEAEDKKEEYLMKCDLYGRCLSEYLLSSGSDVVKKHLEQAHKEMENCDKTIENLKLQKDAYRIEIEIFEANMMK